MSWWVWLLIGGIIFLIYREMQRRPVAEQPAASPSNNPILVGMLDIADKKSREEYAEEFFTILQYLQWDGKLDLAALRAVLEKREDELLQKIAADQQNPSRDDHGQRISQPIDRAAAMVAELKKKLLTAGPATLTRPDER